MEERHKTTAKRLERILLILTFLVATYTLVHVSLPQPRRPLILETIPETTASPAMLLDLNEATAEELESLPGIGPSLAQRILDYRDSIGPFARVEDVLEVSGIGDKTYEKIRPYITIG